MEYNSIIVGGGVAGLTTAAFLCKEGLSVLLLEKEAKVGGLVGSFDFEGFTFDSGVRALENSGILFPMLKNLGIDIELLDNPVSIGIEDKVIDVANEASLVEYQKMLEGLFENDKAEIEKIISIIKKVMGYMDILYGIENPLFMDLKNDKEYLLHTLLPWMFKYIPTAGKMNKYKMPIEEYLKSISNNPSLVDIISQHFFKQTPAFFALNYFALYLEYRYPKGGTGSLTKALEDFILNNGGTIHYSSCVTKVNVASKQISTQTSDTYNYENLVWCADNKMLYELINTSGLQKKIVNNISKRKLLISDKVGGDSVLTLYITTDLSPDYFSNINQAHFFYTPQKKGINNVPISTIYKDGVFSSDKHELFNWLRSFMRFTTFEISIPCLRDADMAPAGKTGLIISTLMDFSIAENFKIQGWYDEFKSVCKDEIINALNSSIYPKLKQNVTNAFVSTPITIASVSGSSQGAITGWAFTNNTIPAVDKMINITQSVKTPIPNVLQAGQWTYSPSGLPISILTGKLAADNILKKAK